MNKPCPSSEQLSADLESLRNLYATAHAALAEMVSGSHDLRQPDTTDQLRQVLQTLDEHEATYRQAVDAWHHADTTPTAECRTRLGEVQQTLERLMVLVNDVTRQAEEAKAKLLPQLSQAAKRRQASAAYQRHRQD